MKISGLSLKITLPALAIVSLAIAFNGYLNYAKFEKHLVRVEMSRMKYVVDDIRGNLETGLRLGLPVRALANAQEAITFVARKDPSIISIEVLDHAGEGLFKAGLEGGLRSAPANWRSTVITRQNSLEQVTPDAFLLIAPLLGITEDFSGALIVRYSRERHDATMREVFLFLAPINLIAILLSIVAGALGIHFLVKDALRRINGVEQALDAGAAAHDVSAPEADSGSAGDVVQSANSVARLALQEIRSVEQAVGRG